MSYDTTTVYVYTCEKCKRCYDSGGVCPSCKDSNGDSIPLRVEPVTKSYYNDELLFKGKVFSK